MQQNISLRERLINGQFHTRNIALEILDKNIITLGCKWAPSINYSMRLVLQNVQLYPAQIPLKRDKEREMEIDSISWCGYEL